MTVRGFVGTFNDDVTDPIRGNGKSMAMTWHAHRKSLEGYEVYTNYKTTFSTQITVDEMIEMFMKRGATFHHVLFCVDEIGEYIDSHGGNTKEVRSFMGMVKQLRKRWSDMSWTNQRYADVSKQVRIQTEEVYKPVKTHLDRRRCSLDVCPKPHLIWLWRVRPPYPRPLCIINASGVGTLYNTEEIIIDKITVPPKK
jgi:hypothetical protein